MMTETHFDHIAAPNSVIVAEEEHINVDSTNGAMVGPDAASPHVRNPMKVVNPNEE